MVQAGSSPRFYITYYGRSRLSRMLAEPVLQFSVLYFCSSKKGEKKGKKRKKKEKWLSSVQCPGFHGCYVL
jgi:hypothetical protein